MYGMKVSTESRGKMVISHPALKFDFLPQVLHYLALFCSQARVGEKNRASHCFCVCEHPTDSVRGSAVIMSARGRGGSPALLIFPALVGVAGGVYIFRPLLEEALAYQKTKEQTEKGGGGANPAAAASAIPAAPSATSNSGSSSAGNGQPPGQSAGR